MRAGFVFFGRRSDVGRWRLDFHFLQGKDCALFLERFTESNHLSVGRVVKDELIVLCILFYFFLADGCCFLSGWIFVCFRFSYQFEGKK